MAKPKLNPTHPLQPKPTGQAAGGKGVVSPEPLHQSARPSKHEAPSDASVQASLSLPHERDQSSDMTAGVRSPEIEQAARDVQNGLKDTSRAPEADRAYKKIAKP